MVLFHILCLTWCTCADPVVNDAECVLLVEFVAISGFVIEHRYTLAPFVIGVEHQVQCAGLWLPSSQHQTLSGQAQHLARH